MERLLEPDEPFEDADDAMPAGYRPGLRVVRNPVITLHAAQGEAFLAGTGDTAGIYHLNPVGAAIWNMLEEPADETEVCEALEMAFPQVGRQVIAGDVAALFRDLYRSGFVMAAADG